MQPPEQVEQAWQEHPDAAGALIVSPKRIAVSVIAAALILVIMDARLAALPAGACC